MKPIFNNKTEMCEYFNFAPKSKADETRVNKAWAIYISNYKGDGCMGCVAEMLTATTHSIKTTISDTGRIDCYIKYKSASGYVVPVSAERKINGGRIKSLETEFTKAEEMGGKFVVYSLDICNSATSNKRRFVPAVVIPRKLFIEKLIEFGIIKAINKGHELNGFGIQASSKVWFDWLTDYPIVYDRNAVYSDDDFEGLF